ncbi:MAG: M13-type metalloendopeptidase, partial [Luteimonas sp.]
AACIAVLASGAALSADHAAPQYGAWGFDLAGADPATKPGDDFFRYANGTWIDKTPIPADKPSYSLRSAMTDTTDQRLRGLIEAAAKQAGHRPTTTEGKVGAFYTSFMDEGSISAKGVSAIAPQLDVVRNAPTRDALAALMGRTNADFEGTLFNFYIDVDLKDPKAYAVYVSQAGLGLPDRDYYLKDEFAAPRAAYLAHSTKLLELIGWPDPAASAKAALAFETEIAKVSWSKTEQRDPVATYNPTTIAELQKFAPGFEWNGFLREAGLSSAPRVVIAEKTAFPKLAALYAVTPLDTLKAWQAMTVADNAAIYLSQPFQDTHFEFHNRALSGQQALEARWKRGVRAVGGGDFLAGDRTSSFGNLGWAVGQMYTARYFPPQAKAKIEDLVDNLKAAFHARIEHLDWMTPATKREALRKLETYTIKVGYPEHARDYSNVAIRDDDLVGNVVRAAAANWSFYTARLGGAVDRSDWFMTPQTNDAYNGSLRDIVFPAGILQPPIFDANADPAINYGAAGGVIGHELTHGFDDQGRKIDADGALRDWWTAEDANAFEARAKLLGAQYSAFEPMPDVHVNGDLTMGENIADLGGLTLALDAYRASLHGKPAPILDGMTGEQRVFIGWAQAWRGKLRADAMRRQVTSDPHSPRMYRVNGVVRNIDAWYELFGVAPADKLYIAPDKRSRIW